MKQLLVAMLLMLAAFSSKAQDDKKIAPYQKDSLMPSFSMLETDSSTWFSSADIPKNKPVVLVYFNPTCGHCQLTAHEFEEKMDSMNDAFFIWVAYNASLSELKDFAKQYKLLQEENIRVGRDTKYFIPPFFKVTYTPYIAIYGSNGKLIETFDGGTDATTVIGLLHKEKSW